ncbi:MAG: AF1514 family protein [Deltaproteobacteria bacterium]|nr:MAG: AF1514 family protein [Deltaproteobacteria bacterium]
MITNKPRGQDYPGDHIKIGIDDKDLELVKAKEFAKQKAKELCPDPMLLSWYQGGTGESYPNLECGRGEKPAWVLYAESRGANLTIDVNDGQYIFIYLCVS